MTPLRFFSIVTHKDSQGVRVEDSGVETSRAQNASPSTYAIHSRTSVKSNTNAAVPTRTSQRALISRSYITSS